MRNTVCVKKIYEVCQRMTTDGYVALNMLTETADVSRQEVMMACDSDVLMA